MRHRRILTSIGLVLALAAVGCGALDRPSAPEVAPEPAAAAEYSLRPGDVIRLRIWREPDLSGEFRVAEDGRVILPKIGTIEAAEHTPAALERLLLREYDRYLRNPSIEIVMLRRINILGAVRAPGLYPVDPTMTLTDALAMAGGVLPSGRQDRVELYRGEQRLTTNVTSRTRIGDLAVRSGDQLYVPERAWASRNAGLIATVASTVIASTVSLIIAFGQ